jgi:hypothetical protein
MCHDVQEGMCHDVQEGTCHDVQEGMCVTIKLIMTANIFPGNGPHL